jgi:hypothetical protein
VSAQIEQLLDVADVDVQMHPVLHRLGAALRAERQKCALLRPTESSRPESLDGAWLDRVDRQRPERDGHTEAVSR